MRIYLHTFSLLLSCTLLAPLTPSQEPAATAEQPAADPEQVAFLRPSGSYADLPEGGFDPTSLLTGGGSPPKAFFPFLQMVDDLAEQDGENVLLDLSAGAGFNLAQQREVERAVGRVRAAGKRIT